MDLGSGGTDPATGNSISTTFGYARAVANARSALQETVAHPSAASHRKASAAYAKASKLAPTQSLTAQHASSALAHANAAVAESHTMRRNG